MATMETKTEEIQALTSTEAKSIGDRYGLVELLIAAARYRLPMAIIVGVFAVGSLVLALLLPKIYQAETRILPPQQNSSLTSSMLGQIAQLGPLASLAGQNVGVRSSSDLYVGLLGSRTVIDGVVQRFHLMEAYEARELWQAREQLRNSTTITANRDGIITLQVEDRDPKRAADLANGYVDELYRLNQSLAITEAAQRRLFFEREMVSAKDGLTSAEIELIKVQEKTGMIQPEGQARAIIESIGALRGQIAAKEVQIRGLRAFATDENPDVRRAEGELETMRLQLAKLQSDTGTGKGDVFVPTGKVPSAGVEYLRRLRDVKYYENIYEVLSKQFELAKLDEAKSAAIVQVVDKAVVPERKFRPRRLSIVFFGTMIGMFFAISWAFLEEYRRRLADHPDDRAMFRLLKERWLGRADPTFPS